MLTFVRALKNAWASFCLRQSPDHGTVDIVVVVVCCCCGFCGCGCGCGLLWLFLVVVVVVVVVLGGTTLVFDFFSRYWNLYKITFVSNNEVTNRANFQPVKTSTFAKKKAKNEFAFFAILWFFKFFDSSNDLKIQIWPHPPKIIWGCPIFFISFFCVTTPSTSKIT